MSAVLGINAVFHDPAAAIVIDGQVIACAEEERFSRRKHGKEAVPFSTWELPVRAARYCLAEAGITADRLDAVGYSYDPGLAPVRPWRGTDVFADDWEALRTLYARRAPRFLQTALPGLDPDIVEFVPHHVAHAASASIAGPFDRCAVLVADGRGERRSLLCGLADGADLKILSETELPHSLGLRYEELTEHLGFRRSSDEYKIMALASYGEPLHLPVLRDRFRLLADGRVETDPIDWSSLAPAVGDGTDLDRSHADLAASVQARVEEILVDVASWLHQVTGERDLAYAGGLALNCVANSRLHREAPFEHIWVQPAAGDAGTALGAALYLAGRAGDRPDPMPSPALGRFFDDATIAETLGRARVPAIRVDDIGAVVADLIAHDRVVGWFQGRAEFGPRALGHRSLLAHPGHAHNHDRLNDIKGRESFRPVAPMVLAERAADLFSGGPLPSPHMLFTHHVAQDWQSRLPAVTHVDGTARIQTVDAADEPLMHRCLTAFEARTGLPVLVNTSFNTAGRPMVDSPRDALECFGSAPIDALAIGSFLVRRGDLHGSDGGGN